MVGCAAFNCVSNSSREQKVSFYKLPRTDKNIKIGKGKKPKDDYDNEQAKNGRIFVNGRTCQRIEISVSVTNTSQRMLSNAIFR